MAYKHEADRYSSTPRKVFDKHVDRMETKRLRDREDHRADMEALIKRLINLETQLHLLRNLKEELEELSSHVDRHCAELDTARDLEGLE